MNLYIEDIPISILIIKRDYEIIFANKKCHDLFGYEPQELIGKNLNVLVPYKSREYHHKAAEEYWEHPCQKQLGIGRNLQGLRKDDVLIPVEIGLYPYENNILVLIVDVTIRNVKNIDENLKNIVKNLEKIKDRMPEK